MKVATGLMLCAAGLLLCAASLHAQTTAGVMNSPLFVATDQNGNIIPGAKLCAYSAGTTTPKDTFADAGGVSANTNPVIMNSSGRATIYGEGNYKLVLLNPGTTTDCTTGTTVWTYDNVFILTATPTFTTVAATTFNSTATGSTNAFQQYLGTFTITGAGNAAFQTVAATSTFNSLATGGVAAFQTSTGTFEAFGNGNFQGQQSFINQSKLQGFAVQPSTGACTSCDVPGSGYALVYYDTAVGAIRYNLGGAGWVSVASTAGANTQVQFNNSGVMGASSHLTFAGDILTLGGSSATGVVAPLFNSTNTGTNAAFQTAGGTFTITGAGNANFQSVTTTNSLTSLASTGVGNAPACFSASGVLFRGTAGCP